MDGGQNTASVLGVTSAEVEVTIIAIEDVEPIDRGGGVVTLPLITRHSNPNALITSGISTYPRGSGAPLHSHNCDEQVTLLDGAAEVEIEGTATRLNVLDTTYIAAGQKHLFRNVGDKPMRILWIYPTQVVLRTLTATGETVEHLSERDLMG